MCFSYPYRMALKSRKRCINKYSPKVLEERLHVPHFTLESNIMINVDNSFNTCACYSYYYKAKISKFYSNSNSIKLGYFK